MIVSAVSNRYKDGDLNEQKEKNIIAERYEIFKCILACINKIKLEECSPMIKSYYFEMKEAYERFYESEDGVPEVTHPSGPCMPGAFRLFVNVDGDFLPCEKVSEKSTVAKVGNLDEGFDFENIYNIMNVGKVGDMCKDCWAYRYCKVCVSAIDDLDKLSVDKKKKCCESIKKEVEKMMKEYCFINEYSNSFYD